MRRTLDASRGREAIGGIPFPSRLEDQTFHHMGTWGDGEEFEGVKVEPRRKPAAGAIGGRRDVIFIRREKASVSIWTKERDHAGRRRS